MTPSENAELAAKQSYHHGNVKAALIEAAKNLLMKEKVQNLTLRRLAKEVGITPTAVYNHFSDKDALIVAIKTEGFEHYNAYLQQHCTETEDPEKMLLQLGIGYYHFSRDFPSQFEILFNYTVSPEADITELLQTSCQSEEQLRDVMRRIFEKHGQEYNDETLIRACLMAWTQIHGLVTLIAAGAIRSTAECQEWPEKFSLVDDKEVDQLIADHISVLIQGITHCECFVANSR